MLQVDKSGISYHQYLEGGGEMGRLTRAFDWGKTAIGDPDTWPQSLLTTVNSLLNSRFPMFLWWGPELIQFYNDAYRPSLGNEGKHPSALGQRGEDCWREIWPVIKPLIDHVISTGESTWSEDQLIPIYRNNRMEDVYWTFSYSRVLDDSGHHGGVLVICTETTDKVKVHNDLSNAHHKLELAQAETEKERDRFKQFIMEAPEGICVLEGPDMVYELVNPVYEQIISGRNLLGNPLFVALPELKDGPIHEILDNVYRTGQPYVGKEVSIPVARSDGGPLEDRYFNFRYLPRHGNNGKVEGILVYVFEVTEMVLAKRFVEESEKRFRFMLNAIPQQVWTAKPDGMLDYVNQVVIKDFGKNEAEINGSGWQAFIHPDDLAGCMEKWNAALAACTEYAVEFRLRFKDGSYKWHLGRALPLIENGEIKLWLGTNTNIDLQKSNEHKKDEFLSIASHELKTPITALKGSMQLLHRLTQTNEWSDKIPVFVTKANTSLNKLVELLDDLLNVSKIQQGQLALNKSWFSLHEMISECCEHVRMDNTHQIKLHGDKELMVYADNRRIDQVVVNFVNNAVKYAPNSIDVDITISHADGNAKISVRDYGIGITADKLPHLFDRYYRVDSSGIQFSGLGLGLYICAEIIKRHNGKIGVESEIGKGSTFWFTIPING